MQNLSVRSHEAMNKNFEQSQGHYFGQIVTVCIILSRKVQKQSPQGVLKYIFFSFQSKFVFLLIGGNVSCLITCFSNWESTINGTWKF